ncbi:hypothetical protein QR680_002327 [Steinernema hermaphroditum]|uniref:Uncharacterized protein n=1 Tax=Steinernema hermaphroditum TaxID=289476 RepID=A0AA39H298_9BILA|nr:hypothetical protein QR680_002327 [Steinernema hermaphroditum]
MDTVPYAFVDFVTELLTHWSIGELVNIRAWTEIAQVHKQERRSYGINFWCTEQGVQGAFIRAYSGPSPYLNVKEVLKTERRFLRIWHFANTESIKPPRDQKRLLTFKYDQLAKLEKFIVSHSYAHLSVYNKKLQPSLLNAFFRKVYFTAGISLTNNCPLAADFVKDQMEHSTTLLHVNLRKKWDPSMLPYIKKFCLRPNVMLFRNLWMFGEQTVNSNALCTSLARQRSQNT